MVMLLEIHKKAAICRAFEEEVYRRVQDKTIKIPVYLSAGQEYISATLATYLESIDKQIFIQHRGHSTYLSFGGDMDELILELLGDKRGCSGGMGGSASIQSKEKKIYGHDGLMGSHGPIATGACYGNKKFTLCFTGDAAAEEDYFVAAMGWASTKALPIWYIVEDNNLSILTEKKVRRNWEMQDVANAYKMKGIGCDDDPIKMLEILKTCSTNQPLLLNISTNRKFWHAGAGIDDPNTPDRHKEYTDYIGGQHVKDAEELVREAWIKHLR
jgi:pyruvate dehydrogenase E1 component alpha subunit